MSTEQYADHIAVVGLACRVPGADTPTAFWELLTQGRCAVTRAGDQGRADDDGFVAAGGALAGFDRFDAAFFGFTSREADITDPQQRLLLECVWEALEDAGHIPGRFAGRIGLYAGAGDSTYLERLKADAELRAAVGDEQLTLANGRDFLCTRVAHRLDLRGPVMTVQTACSSSLVAVHQAVRSLQSHECDLAVAGGVSVSVEDSPGYTYRPGGVLSPDGVCRAFSDDAEGTVPGDGAGVVVLRRLADALADGDHVHAVIRGSAVNNDGAARAGFTAPSPQGQAEVIAEALALAELDPDDIGYVETHGTGTQLGDPIELSALQQVFDGTPRQRPLAIGSVKPSIGHLDVAAGVIGLVKAVLAVEHGAIPPSLHVSEPTSRIDFADSRVRVNTALRPWEDEVRRAGVSSFGIGGTNAHVVVEQPPRAAAAARTGAAGPEVLVVSARDEESLDRAVARLQEWTPAESARPADVAATLQSGRREFTHRAFTLVSSLGETGQAPWQRAVAAERVPVFFFPGQGTQYPGMASRLYEAQEVFRTEIDRCAELLAPRLGLDLRELLRGERPELLDETRFTQPVLFAVEYALARLWEHWGVRAAAMVGHSLGEYVAATLAGVFRLEDALAVIAERGRLMQSLPEGRMLAVHLGAEALEGILARHEDLALDIAALNAAELTVLAGTPEAVERCESLLGQAGVKHRRLRGSRAFHSRMTEPVLEEFGRIVAGTPLAAPTTRFVSNVTGTWIDPAQATDPAYWVEQLRRPVRFAEGVAALLDLGPGRVGIEAGPGHTLTRLAASLDPELDTVASLPHATAQDTDDVRQIRTALGRCWTLGVPVDWTTVRPKDSARTIPLPTYPFRRDRHGAGAGRGPVEPAEPATSGTAATGVEETVAGLWRQLLGVTSVGPADDFFELGGDSLVGIQLLTRVRREFGIRLSPAELFDHPLLGDFTAEVVRRTTGDSKDGLAGLLTELEGLSDAEVDVLLATPSTKEGRLA